MYSFIIVAVLSQPNLTLPNATESYFSSKVNFIAVLKETAENPNHLHVFHLSGKIRSKPVNHTGRSPQTGRQHYRVVSPYGFSSTSLHQIIYEITPLIHKRLKEMRYEGEVSVHKFQSKWALVNLNYEGRSIEGCLIWIFKLEDNGIINIDEFSTEE